jgi:hypothetical protein
MRASCTSHTAIIAAHPVDIRCQPGDRTVCRTPCSGLPVCEDDQPPQRWGWDQPPPSSPAGAQPQACSPWEHGCTEGSRAPAQSGWDALRWCVPGMMSIPSSCICVVLTCLLPHHTSCQSCYCNTSVLRCPSSLPAVCMCCAMCCAHAHLVGCRVGHNLGAQDLPRRCIGASHRQALTCRHLQQFNSVQMSNVHLQQVTTNRPPMVRIDEYGQEEGASVAQQHQLCAAEQHVCTQHTSSAVRARAGSSSLGCASDRAFGGRATVARAASALSSSNASTPSRPAALIAARCSSSALRIASASASARRYSCGNT